MVWTLISGSIYNASADDYTRIMQLVIAKSTPYMISNMGYGTYFLFASFMTIAFLWVCFLLPETRGIRLEEMDALFGAIHPMQVSTSLRTDETGKESPERPPCASTELKKAEAMLESV
jgi:hypothetical protein